MSQSTDYRRGRHVVSCLHAHLVFVTKCRHPVFTSDHLRQLHVIFDDVCSDFGVELVEFNGGAEHVHLLVEYPATVQLSKLVNSLKGVKFTTHASGQPRVGAALLAGQASVVGVVLCRGGGWCTTGGCVSLHRGTTNTGQFILDLKSGALSRRGWGVKVRESPAHLWVGWHRPVKRQWSERT